MLSSAVEDDEWRNVFQSVALEAPPLPLWSKLLTKIGFGGDDRGAGGTDSVKLVRDGGEQDSIFICQYCLFITASSIQRLVHIREGMKSKG